MMHVDNVRIGRKKRKKKKKAPNVKWEHVLILLKGS
jgi:hypothetical protein